MTDCPADFDRDLATWKAAAEGDAEARQDLIERAWRASAPRLRSFAADAQEEIRQGIAESVLRALETGLSPDSSLDGFLQWRGRAEISSFIRKNVRNRTMTSLDQTLDLAGFEDSALRNAEAAELRRVIEGCGETIPNENQQRAWRLRFLRGVEPRDIAPMLGVSADITRMWISRASQIVRRCIERKLGRSGEDA